MKTNTHAPVQLNRDLKNRHIQMIALGGAIGSGLFYGSAEGIQMAGPSILLAYLVGGTISFLIVRALGEMSVYRATSGAFSDYAFAFWSPQAAFVSGWNYWFNYIAVAMSELTVVGIYINFWFPSVPRWITAAFVLALIMTINLVGVKTFGEFEFWLALIKVVAVIAMIVLGIIIIIFGINSDPNIPAPSFAHLWNDGGFFPHGVWGMISAFVVVMFSFGGVELIGITAGETKDPKQSIPRAINRVVLRILIFYIGSLAVIMSVIPWTQIDGKQSPFVQIFETVGINFAAHILNFVVLTAAISVYNSGLYSNSRMLYSLSKQHNAPVFLSQLGKNGVPFWGVICSSAVTVIAVVVVFIAGDQAFSAMISVAIAAAVINWAMIMITQYHFRKALGPQRASKLSFRLPGGSVTTVVVLAFLAFVVVLMALIPSYRLAIIVGPIWVIALLIAYQIKIRIHPEKEHAAIEDLRDMDRHIALGLSSSDDETSAEELTTTNGDH